jgi:hypothetical protein
LLDALDTYAFDGVDISGEAMALPNLTRHSLVI